MHLPKLTKSEALRLECVRIASDVARAKSLYEFIIEGNQKPSPKPTKKPQRK